MRSLSHREDATEIFSDKPKQSAHTYCLENTSLVSICTAIGRGRAGLHHAGAM